MKSSNNKMFETATTSHNRRRFASILTVCLLGVSTLAMFADGGPEILPIRSHPYGQTYGEWSVLWWQWALGIPAANNPVTDTTGEFAGVGQSGPVWFLAGAFGSSVVERTFAMPAGKAIFMPVHNWIFGAIAGDCNPSNPGVPCDIPTLRAAAAAATETAQTLDVLIDGQTVANVRNYRAISPGGFNVTLPADAVLGLPTGTFGPHVADGYWLMLPPLEVGTHTIWLHVVNPPFALDYAVTYHITVQGGHSASAESD